MKLTIEEQTRCEAHHPESWWPSNKRCDKSAGHKGKHVAQRQTLYGPDPGEFFFWDNAGNSFVAIDKQAQRAFLAQIEAKEASCV